MASSKKLLGWEVCNSSEFLVTTKIHTAQPTGMSIRKITSHYTLLDILIYLMQFHGQKLP